MSNTRRISASSFTGSVKSGFCQSIGWRVGASRLPSREVMVGGEWRIANGKKGKWRVAALFAIRHSPFAYLLAERVERLLEASGMALFRFRESLEPVGDFIETFRARGLGHARIHVGVFVRFARDRGFEVQVGATDRLAGRRIADGFEEFEMTVRMARFAFRGGAEHGGDVVV